MEKTISGSHNIVFQDSVGKLGITLGKYYSEGYGAGKRLLFAFNEITPKDIRDALSPFGLNLDELRANGKAVLVSAEESYLKGGSFSPDRMLKVLEDATIEALDDGFTGVQGAGDMSWIFQYKTDTDALLDYESRLNDFVSEYPYSASCIFDISRMERKSLLQISKLHPSVITPGGSVQNYDYFQRSTESSDDVHEECTDLLRGSARMVSAILEMRCLYVENHAENVARLAKAIAFELDRDLRLAHTMEMAGRIHDTGMLPLFSDMISKPGRLLDFERQMIQEHPLTGYELAKKLPYPVAVSRAVLEHHEKLDGTGYPLGLKGSEISFEGKILAVSEVVSAMSFYRPYREQYGTELALDEIMKNAGKHYEREVANACLRCFEKGFEFSIDR